MMAVVKKLKSNGKAIKAEFITLQNPFFHQMISQLHCRTLEAIHKEGRKRTSPTWGRICFE